LKGESSYYKILGVDESASNHELRKAFCKLSIELHPDTTSLDRDDAKSKFQEVLEAYENLNNSNLRKIYDDKLKEKNKIGIFADLKIFIINLGFSGLAISFGVLLLKLLRYISSSFGDFSKEIISSLPVFPFILIGSLLIRYILEKTKNTEFISNILQREIGILSTDLLIFTAMASLDIAVVFDNWILILVFTIFGLLWNLIVLLILHTLFLMIIGLKKV